MARFVVGMNQSLDGYVDHMAFAPSPGLFRHFIEEAKGTDSSIYGRTMYGVMRYWDEERPEWGAAEREYGVAWRAQRKWVVSGSLKSVGPNATLISSDFEAQIRKLKVELSGDVDISGTLLAHSLADLGLIDQYNLYFHPVVLGSGTPFFAGPRPPLQLAASERLDGGVMKLTYIAA